MTVKLADSDLIPVLDVILQIWNMGNITFAEMKSAEKQPDKSEDVQGDLI
jgi:hypothetical protein